MRELRNDPFVDAALVGRRRAAPPTQPVIASEAKQSPATSDDPGDCHVAARLAMTDVQLRVDYGRTERTVIMRVDQQGRAWELRGCWLKTREPLFLDGEACRGEFSRQHIPAGTIGRIVAQMSSHLAVEWTVGDRTYDTLITLDRLANDEFDVLTDADLEPA